ncbi:hypothetical protein L905_20270 [Agrobacterium sp. TS43]|nr:hypothetical protein L902_04290 [Agrobacterium radiobacter DSM 30147]KVK45689.1 hypothetical protein L904_24980 [Agrobacterium sp. LY4]KVK45800.1 hypothetical protein L903_25115 [Agrobacterium sp. JL28]KVK59415.1 hypothetical protein L906_24695 [Agrobacterium sp. TS45]KVK63222.1 hypothetical protein L905_20270 [Agrobacterium sp. TS43]KVK63715.1 hypothetical protein L907_24515 [Agrobacterium sp. C13]
MEERGSNIHFAQQDLQLTGHCLTGPRLRSPDDLGFSISMFAMNLQNQAGGETGRGR